MYKQLFLAAVCSAAALSGAAMAASGKAKGFYIGGAAGISEFDDDGAFNNASFDDSDTSLTLLGGYKFLPYFALEGRVSDLGSYSFSGGGEISIDVVSVHAVGIIPFGQSGWELFGQLGLGRADINCFGCSDETVGSAGLGVRYFPTQNLSVGFQVDAYAYEEDGFNSQTFDIGVGTSQVSLQYLF